MDNQDYHLKMDAFFLPLIRKWPLILVLGFVSALAGLGLSSIREPRYEAKAVMGINIQYGVIEPLELVVEDRAQNRVAELILADSTILLVLENLPEDIRQEQDWHDPADLSPSLRLDRGLSDWRFVVTHTDPVIAAQIADIWMMVSLTELDEAQDHAWQAVALMHDEPFQLECDQYLLPSESSEEYAWRCDLEPISLDTEALAGQLRTEINLSRGILPVFSFEGLHAADVPHDPVLYHRGVLVLGGAIIGLLIGIWIVSSLHRRSSE